MNEFLLSQPTLVGSIMSILIATVSGLPVYLLAYRLIDKYKTSDLKDPTSGLFRVVGTLVSLMLSLAFAEVIVDLRNIENAIEREAVAIADTFNDLYRFDVEATRESRSLLLEYTQAVIDDDWPALADDRLGERAGKLKKQLEESVWKLQPETPMQEKLWSQVLSDIDAISDHRLVRLENALAEPPLYLYVIVFGLLVTMACFGAYQPQGPLVVLVSLYTVFVGLVLYLVLALSDPFQGGIGVDPATFELLVEVMQARST